jgi:hypothetical protein
MIEGRDRWRDTEIEKGIGKWGKGHEDRGKGRERESLEVNTPGNQLRIQQLSKYIC